MHITPNEGVRGSNPRVGFPQIRFKHRQSTPDGAPPNATLIEQSR
jgi:hypothetical protein